MNIVLFNGLNTRTAAWTFTTAWCSQQKHSYDTEPGLTQITTGRATSADMRMSKSCKDVLNRDSSAEVMHPTLTGPHKDEVNSQVENLLFCPSAAQTSCTSIL